MRNFDVKKYIEEGKTTYSKRKDIEALADKVTARGYNNIVIIGIGGTWAEMASGSSCDEALYGSSDLSGKCPRNFVLRKTSAI